jgi:hypothetical protein
MPGTEAEEIRRDAEEAGEPMSPAGRLFRERHFNCYIVAVVGLGKAVDVAAARAGMQTTLVRHPRFCSVQVWPVSCLRTHTHPCSTTTVHRFLTTSFLLHLAICDLPAPSSLGS